MQIPVHFNPRPYQEAALTALENGVRRAVWCWARRGGKDMTAFAYAIKKMVESPMNVVLVFPVKEQGKNAFWENIENDGFKTIEHIPGALIDRQDNSNMRIVLKNGSTFQILGAGDPDALRGANGKLYILSEFVDIPSQVMDVIGPVVRNNGGQIIIQSTPKIDGISGGTFKMLFDRATKREDQYASLITADNYLTAAELEDERQECIEKNGNDFWFRQEFLCDWGQASASSYYGAVMMAAVKENRIGKFPYEPAYPAYSTWDYGMDDSTAIGWWQYIDKKPRVIDYYETHDIALRQTIEFVKQKPYNTAWHFFPHDMNVRDSDAIARIEKVRDYGLINSSLLKREPKEDGIKRAVEGTMFANFNEATTTELRRKLILYKRKFNPLTGDYEGPQHKTESHAADEHRYMFAAIEQEFDPKTGAFYFAPGDGEIETYEMDGVDVAPQYNPYY
jgi:phage terminase large subunit